MLSRGDRAPDFTLPDQDGNKVKLTDLNGETVVVYFYPRADTPGCTTQACGIRDRGDEYASGGRAGARDLARRAGGDRQVRRQARASTSPCSPTPTTRSPTPTAPGARSRCTARSTWGCCARPSSSTRGQDRPGLPESPAEKARRPRAQGARPSSPGLPERCRSAQALTTRRR